MVPGTPYAHARVPIVAGSTPDALWSSSAVRLLQPAAVACRRLRKRVGRSWVLDGVELAVSSGARLLLIANPEGAASLLLRILAGIARADRGEIELAGIRGTARLAQRARRVAYVGPGAGLYPWMSPREALDLAGRLAELGRVDGKARIERAIGRWGLAASLGRPLRSAGPGIAQRTAMAAALLIEPEVLLLDEPLRAVDPEERVRLLRIPGRRLTVILVSRYPASETGAVNEIALLRNGRVALHAPLSALEARGLPLSQRGIESLADSVGGDAHHVASA
jgi:ABC-type multidrug transport system ATPase subunit